MQPLAKMETEAASAASRKRKQASSQKLFRSFGVAKKRRENVKTNGHQNLIRKKHPNKDPLTENSTGTQFLVVMMI